MYDLESSLIDVEVNFSNRTDAQTRVRNVHCPGGKLRFREGIAVPGPIKGREARIQASHRGDKVAKPCHCQPQFLKQFPFCPKSAALQRAPQGYFPPSPPMATSRDSSAILKWHHHSNSRAEQEELFLGGPAAPKNVACWTWPKLESSRPLRGSGDSKRPSAQLLKPLRPAEYMYCKPLQGPPLPLGAYGPIITQEKRAAVSWCPCSFGRGLEPREPPLGQDASVPMHSHDVRHSPTASPGATSDRALLFYH
jgi:hypothetical protein